MSELVVGDLIKTRPHQDILQAFNVYSIKQESIFPLKVIDIADQFGTVLSVDVFVIEILLENDTTVNLPIEAVYTFYEYPEIFDEFQNNEPEPENTLQISNSSDQETMVHHLAAESIQANFRRYKECKTAIKMRRMLSTENLVLNLAAETITKNLKRAVSKSRLSRTNSHQSLSQMSSVTSLGIAV